MNLNHEEVIFKPYVRVTLGREKNGTRFVIWVSEEDSGFGATRVSFVSDMVIEGSPRSFLPQFLDKVVQMTMDVYEKEKFTRRQA